MRTSNTAALPTRAICSMSEGSMSIGADGQTSWTKGGSPPASVFAPDFPARPLAITRGDFGVALLEVSLSKIFELNSTRLRTALPPTDDPSICAGQKIVGSVLGKPNSSLMLIILLVTAQRLSSHSKSVLMSQHRATRVALQHDSTTDLIEILQFKSSRAGPCARSLISAAASLHRLIRATLPSH